MLLDKWFKEEAISNPEVFPRQNPDDYLTLYDGITRFLRPYHEEIERVAVIHDGGYLTGHGPEHIKTVIERASKLIFDLNFNFNPESDDGFTPYHAYLLLVAIQLHDIGNALGREHHERKIGEIVSEGGNIFGSEAIEKRVIQRIAAAHGGYVGRDKNNKDTIAANCLQKFETLVNRRVPIQLLAATLRLADELADDYTRASLVARNLDMIPTSSQVFHEYAKCLHSVQINRDDRRVELSFSMHADNAKRLYGKGEQQVFLLDEIHERTWKLYRECLYCMKYMRATQTQMRILEAVKVHIEIANGNEEVYSPYDENAIDPIEYIIEEKGYPRAGAAHLREFIPDLRPSSGAEFKARLEGDEAEAALATDSGTQEKLQ